MDLVVGSGKIGQTYLYWRDGILFELPVSWLTGAQHWINSPGFPDGVVNIVPGFGPTAGAAACTW